MRSERCRREIGSEQVAEKGCGMALRAPGDQIVRGSETAVTRRRHRIGEERWPSAAAVEDDRQPRVSAGGLNRDPS
jgi:hypothetical protein